MKAHPKVTPPTDAPAQGSLSTGASSLGILVATLVAFGLMLVAPEVGHALGAVLLGLVVVLPATFLLLSLRKQHDPAVDPMLCVVLALGIVGLVINSAVRKGPDWRLGICLLSAMLWLVVAGVGWSKSR